MAAAYDTLHGAFESVKNYTKKFTSVGGRSEHTDEQNEHCL